MAQEPMISLVRTGAETLPNIQGVMITSPISGVICAFIYWLYEPEPKLDSLLGKKFFCLGGKQSHAVRLIVDFSKRTAVSEGRGYQTHLLVYRIMFHQEPTSTTYLQGACDRLLLTNTVPYKPPGNKAYSAAVKKQLPTKKQLPGTQKPGFFSRFHS